MPGLCRSKLWPDFGKSLSVARSGSDAVTRAIEMERRLTHGHSASPSGSGGRIAGHITFRDLDANQSARRN